MRWLLFVLATATALPAQDKKDPKKDPPGTVLYAVPLVVKPGEKQKLTLRGRGLDTTKDVKPTGAATAKVLAARKVGVPNNYPGERVGDSEVEVELEVPKDAKPGSVTLVAVGPNGASAAYTALVRDDLPAVAEKEDNGGFDAAQPVPVPCGVEGTIRGERDVDVFRFDGKKGEAVKVEVQAARFGSPVDALVMVYDADRRVLAGADDANGSADPVLTVTPTRDGPVFVTVIDAHDLGGANFGYRLVLKRSS